MRDTTKDEYRRMAEGFYQKHLQGQPPSPKRLKDALIGLQGELRPNYWRKLKIAIAFDQREKGHSKAADKVQALVNQVTAKAEKSNDWSGVKAKRPRVKKITPDDGRRINKYLHAKDDTLLSNLYHIARLTGCRPSEAPSVRLLKDARGYDVAIDGAKTGKKRGVETRTLRGYSKDELRFLRKAGKELREAQEANPNIIKALQKRFDRVMENVFPKREHKPTLYTLRHHFGSNLKKSGLSREAMAYCMGHQGTKSIEVYGDRRSGSGKFNIGPGGDYVLDKDIIRTTHKDPSWAPPQETVESQMESVLSNAESAPTVEVNNEAPSIDEELEREVSSYFGDDDFSP